MKAVVVQRIGGKWEVREIPMMCEYFLMMDDEVTW